MNSDARDVPLQTPARPGAGASHIPIPQTLKRPKPGMAPSQPLTAGGGPSRLQAPASRSVSGAGRAASLPARATAGASAASRKPGTGLTVPRPPMANATNRVGALNRSTSTSAGGLAKGKTAVGGVAIRTVSGASAASRDSGGRSSDSGDPSRMDAIESKMSSMQDLFELERKRTEDLLAKERTERLAQEEKVRQLEEDLTEQRRVAVSSKQEAARRRTMADDEILQLNAKHSREKRMLEEDLERERQAVSALKSTLSQQSTAHLTLESTNSALRTQVTALQSELETQRSKISELEVTLVKTRESSIALENELREAESLRRKLHNEVQELRGNIRVFCRVRPASRNDAINGAEAGGLATIRYPNEKEATQIEMLAMGESAAGTATMKNHLFTFDRIFQPSASQADVFEEIAHLTQSVLDGYNTSIFAYGQTGSGKTHTLEGAPASANSPEPSADEGAGLIPRAVQMLWSTAEALKDKGWRYEFEGQMLEIYNEGINDLLGKAEVDKAKHEIKHEKNRTIVTDTVVVPLETPAQVFALLSKAKNRRQVAATLMNERSSRSHSVFSLRVRGQNATTMESCDAVLSLVDLAGSERLSNSGSGNDPQRLKEAQCINKSLSSLADVIAALGSGKQGGHVPYRNSTLTWLLKNSLGGNSKTLMLLALSPMAAHLNESLCSLRFATKVNNTVVGTARKVIKAAE